MFEKLTKNFLWLLLDRSIRIIFGIFIGAWIARYLGPENYGILMYVIAYVALFATAGNLGLDGILLRKFSKNADSSQRIINTTLVLRIIAGIILWIITSLSILYFEGNSTIFYFVCLLGLMIPFQSFDVFEIWFQSQSENRKSVISRLTALLVCGMIKIFLILMNFNIVYFIIITAFETILTAFLFIVFYRKKHKFKFALDVNISKSLLNESWPFILSGVSILLYMRVDLLLIKYFLNLEQVGIYSVGIILSQFWYFLPVIISTVIAPKLAKAMKKDETYFNKLIRYYMLLFFLLGISIFIFTFMFGTILINLLYGEDYEAASKVLLIHSVTNIPVCMGVIAQLWIINQKKGVTYFKKTIMGLIVSIIANIILIPKYGIIGASYSAVLAQFVSAFFSNYFFVKPLFFLQLGFKIRNDS
tara:strand:- start:740 stop:1993 length:1254 start_codon:yes stop_codon:yes gene_type:complete